jgi:hypothetical protein
MDLDLRGKRPLVTVRGIVPAVAQTLADGVPTRRCAPDRPRRGRCRTTAREQVYGVEIATDYRERSGQGSTVFIGVPLSGRLHVPLTGPRPIPW